MQWTEVHNTALEISGETGIPGLLIYAAAVVVCFKRISAIRKAVRNRAELKQIGDMAFCLFLSLWAWLIMALFSPNAYYFHFPMLAGLTGAFDLAAWGEIRASQPLAAVAAIGPVPARAAWQAVRPRRSTAATQR